MSPAVVFYGIGCCALVSSRLSKRDLYFLLIIEQRTKLSGEQYNTIISPAVNLWALPLAFYPVCRIGSEASDAHLCFLLQYELL